MISSSLGVIRPAPGAFTANFKSNLNTLVINKTVKNAHPLGTIAYPVQPDNPYFFIYGGIWLIDSGGNLVEPDIFVKMTATFLNGGSPVSSIDFTLYGGTTGSPAVNFPFALLNYDGGAPAVTICTASNCVSIGASNPPTTWAFGTRWTSVADKVTYDFTVLDSTTQAATPSSYVVAACIFQLPWGT